MAHLRRGVLFAFSFDRGHLIIEWEIDEWETVESEADVEVGGGMAEGRH